jgi:HD superfamily phosphohydrolase
VTFGLALDHERLLRHITVAYAPRRESKVIPDKMEIVGLGVAEKALVVAQGLVKIREDLFTQVYWHHTVRSLKAMLGFAVRNTLLCLEDRDNIGKKDEFWSSFHAEVLWPSRMMHTRSAAPEKPTIVASEPHTVEDLIDDDTAADDIIGSSGLSPTDDALLLFLRRFARKREQRVIDAIRNRGMFKRLYVLTYSREREAYDAIYNRFHTFRLAENLREIEHLRKNCEDLVESHVLESIDKQLQDQPSAELTDIRNQIVAADPLILLDVPVKVMSRSIERESIYYISEDIGGLTSRPDGESHLFATPASLDQTPFDRAVGKIRLFAPPGLKDALLRFIPEHETITEFLNR